MRVTPELIVQCKKGNKKAYKQLYEVCFAFLMDTALRFATDRDEAVDFLNTAFAKAVLNLSKFSLKEKTPFEAWIKKILINEITDRYRKRKAGLVFSDLSENDGSVSLSLTEINSALQNMALQELYGMIQLLPPMCRAVFNLYAIDGYSHKEIAEKLEISDGTSKFHLSEARRKLKNNIALANTPKIQIDEQ